MPTEIKIPVFFLKKPAHDRYLIEEMSRVKIRKYEMLKKVSYFGVNAQIV